MESRTSSKSNLSESSSWDFDTMCQNTAKLDEMMLSRKQEENMKRKDTLAKREEVAWQREEIIHTREKELREWELMLEERSRMLNEKEKQLKYEEREEKSLRREAVRNSEKNSRKSSLSDISLCTFTFEEHAKNTLKNEFGLEREKLLHQKETFIAENIMNLDRKEQSLVMKEEQLNNQRIVIDKERKLVAQKNNSLDLREQVVKKLEEAVERKLMVVREETKSLNERIMSLTQKENALSDAAEHIQNKEQALNERENSIIEKERNFIGQITELGKHTVTESLGEKTRELIKIFDEIFGDKWKCIQEREETISNNEQILLEKWKEYSEAKEHLKSEEESLCALRDTFEKEKSVLREWEKLLKKREDEIDKKHELIRVPSDKNNLCDESGNAWPSPLPLALQAQEPERTNRSSPFGAVGELLHAEISSGADKNIDLSRRTPNSENREISGDELFKFYEKEKESLQALLLKENVNTSTKLEESNNSEGNQMLTRPVEAFFRRMSASPSLGESKGEQVVNGRISLLPSGVPEERTTEVFLREGILNYPSEPYLLDNSSASSKRSVLLEINEESNKKSNMIPSSNLQNDTSVKTEEKNDNKQSETHNGGGKDASISQNSRENQNPQESGNVFQNTGSVSAEKEKIRVENAIHDNDSGTTSAEVSHARVSPLSSASSSRSATSPINGRSSPWFQKSKKKPAKDALLQAISKRNFLETVQLLDTNCMSMEVRNDEGRSAVLLAVQSGNIELIERLINKGADIRACDYKGNSALHIAVAENNSDMVLYLLKKELNPRVTDINGNTALDLASHLKHSTLLEILRNHIAAISS